MRYVQTQIVNISSRNPKNSNFELSCISEFDKESKSEKKIAEGQGGGGGALIPKQYARLIQIQILF